MEEELEKHKDHPVVSKMYFPELNRKQSLEEDLAFYYGPNWRDEIVLTKGGKKYVDRIREISELLSLNCLVGHSYTRYLGDLSGGQILKNISQRAMNLAGSDGVAFYEFPTISDEKAFKDNYRASLGEAPVDDANG